MNRVHNQVTAALAHYAALVNPSSSTVSTGTAAVQTDGDAEDSQASAIPSDDAQPSATAAPDGDSQPPADDVFDQLNSLELQRTYP